MGSGAYQDVTTSWDKRALLTWGQVARERWDDLSFG